MSSEGMERKQKEKEEMKTQIMPKYILSQLVIILFCYKTTSLAEQIRCEKSYVVNIVGLSEYCKRYLEALLVSKNQFHHQV